MPLPPLPQKHCPMRLMQTSKKSWRQQTSWLTLAGHLILQSVCQVQSLKPKVCGVCLSLNWKAKKRLGWTSQNCLDTLIKFPTQPRKSPKRQERAAKVKTKNLTDGRILRRPLRTLTNPTKSSARITALKNPIRWLRTNTARYSRNLALTSGRSTKTANMTPHSLRRRWRCWKTWQIKTPRRVKTSPTNFPAT